MEKSIRLVDPVFTANEELVVETEMILPEYFPEVSKILDCRVSYAEESVVLTSDRISCGGKATFTLIYVSDDNILTSFSSPQKFTKSITGGAFDAADVCRITFLPGNLHFRALAPRRIELKAISTVQAEVYRVSEKNIPDAEKEPAVQRHVFHSDLFSVGALAEITLSLNDRLTLPDKKDKISGFSMLNGKIQVEEVNCIRNKVLIKGSLTVLFDCLATSGAVHSGLTASFPFSEVRDVFGVAEDTTVLVSLGKPDLEVDLKSASFGDNEAPFTAKINVLLIGGTADTLEGTDDLYVPNGKASTVRDKFNLTTAMQQIDRRETFTLEAQNTDSSIRDIASLSVSDLVYKMTTRGESVILSGSLRISALCALTENNVCCVSRKAAFETEIPASGTDLIFPDVSVENLQVEKRTDSLLFSGEIRVNGIMLKRSEKSIVSVNGPVTVEQTKNDRIILYYANAGEDLWTIAKENDAHYDRLDALNENMNDSIDEPRILILN